MRRLVATLGVLVLAWASSALMLGAAASPRFLHRADAEAVALHGFYDHEGLVPVPLFNLSVPYATARYEPGPSTEALGSFLWEREAANLGNIVCALTENRFCELPAYPFRAHAAHPSSGGDGSPPTLTIDEDGAPIEVRAAHEDAAASPRGAAAEANVQRMAAIPMTPPQAAAAGRFAAAVSLVTDAEAEPTPWLVAVRQASAETATRSHGTSIASRGTAVAHGLELLGGLVTIDVARGEAAVTTTDGGAGEARARLGGLRVADLRAELGPDGLEVVDGHLDAGELGQVTAALDELFRQAGLRISRGKHGVRTGGEVVTAEAYAVRLSLRRQVLPDDLPEGTTGDDVLDIPIGWARAAASTTEVASVETPPPAAAPRSATGVSSGGVPPSAGVPPASPAVPSGAAGPEAVDAAPASYPIALGVPPGALAGIVAGAALLLGGLTWLKVAEVLSE